VTNYVFFADPPFADLCERLNMTVCSPQGLVRTVLELAADLTLSSTVDKRISDFQRAGSQDSHYWFEELIFCILTANSKAETGFKCVEALKNKGLIFEGSQGAVAETLKEMGHRFAKIRAQYIVSGRDKHHILKEDVLSFDNSLAAREWLVNEFMGIGWKESSHFLRNVGIFDLAILDRHILKIMLEHSLIAEPQRSLTKRRYLEYETVLREFSREVNMPLGKLDLYLWYMKTGKVLK